MFYIIIFIIIVKYLADTHLVGGECARFVRTDNSGTAESLNRGERPDDAVLLSHSSSSCDVIVLNVTS